MCHAVLTAQVWQPRASAVSGLLWVHSWRISASAISPSQSTKRWSCAAPATTLQLIRASANAGLTAAVGPIFSSAELTRNVMRGHRATSAPLLRIASRTAAHPALPNARRFAGGWPVTFRDQSCAAGPCRSWNGSWNERRSHARVVGAFGAFTCAIRAGRASAAAQRSTLNPRVRGSSPWRRTHLDLALSDPALHWRGEDRGPMSYLTATVLAWPMWERVT